MCVTLIFRLVVCGGGGGGSLPQIHSQYDFNLLISIAVDHCYLLIILIVLSTGCDAGIGMETAGTEYGIF